METPILAAAAGAAAMLLLVVLVLTVTRRRRSRQDLEAMLDAAQRETDALRQRLEELTGQAISAQPQAPGHALGRVPDPIADEVDFVITHVGEPDPDLDPARAAELVVPDRLVLSATLGEPLVKVAAFSHGVRRALSAQSRNRIWFEMRREVRASRRRRRQLRKRLEREHRARLRTTDDLTLDRFAAEDLA